MLIKTKICCIVVVVCCFWKKDSCICYLLYRLYIFYKQTINIILNEWVWYILSSWWNVACLSVFRGPPYSTIIRSLAGIIHSLNYKKSRAEHRAYIEVGLSSMFKVALSLLRLKLCFSPKSKGRTYFCILF